MRASLEGRDELVVQVQTALCLPTKKEAEPTVNIVIQSLEATLLKLDLIRTGGERRSWQLQPTDRL